MTQDDILPAMLAIQRVSTQGGEAMTYRAKRNAEIGHADVTWATLHAIEPAEFDDLISANEETADDDLGAMFF